MRNGVHEERSWFLVLTLNIKSYIPAASLCVYGVGCLLSLEDSSAEAFMGQALYNLWRFDCWKKHEDDTDFHSGSSSSA